MIAKAVEPARRPPQFTSGDIRILAVVVALLAGAASGAIRSELDAARSLDPSVAANACAAAVIESQERQHGGILVDTGTAISATTGPGTVTPPAIGGAGTTAAPLALAPYWNRDLSPGYSNIGDGGATFAINEAAPFIVSGDITIHGVTLDADKLAACCAKAKDKKKP